MSTSAALVIDTDPERGDHLRIILEYLDYAPTVITDCERWEAHCQAPERYDIVVLGPSTPGNGLLEVFRRIKARDDHVPIVALVDPGADAALEPELERGSIAKVRIPVRHAELQNALGRVRMYRESRHLAGGPRSIELFRNLVGTSGAIREVRRLIEQVAATDASVLLSGESGTGKEVVARNIHYQSKRRYKPFVPVNCGAIPPMLLESELFGHEKGAFTGAISSRRGRFEMADGGTLFLDEIGDMPLEMQVKLLRVIQERTFEHVGSNKSISMDVRIIAASNVDLEEAIRAGRFRDDLYYRLSVFPIHMPSLRERIEDLGLLINDLINRLASEKRGTIRFTRPAFEALSRYRWPGNVRELANLIERLLILYPNGVVDEHDLPEKYRTSLDSGLDCALDSGLNSGFELGLDRGGERSGAARDGAPIGLGARGLPREGIDLKEHLVDVEYRLIEQALEECGGVVAHAAKRLRLGRTTLVEKMRKFGMTRATGRASDI